jgi:hypothetical protein
VKPIKMLGLAALAALMAMAFVGASSAMASSTQLCTSDPSGGSCSTATSSIHEVSSGKGKLLTGSNTVECNVLFSSLSVGALGSPQTIEGHFTYSSCGICSVHEATGTTSTIEILRTGHETAEVTGNGEVSVSCFFINCTYDGEGLNGTGKGPLLSAGTRPNGEVSIQGQETHPVAGPCEEAGFLDLTTTPLSATYIGKGPLKMVCMDVGPANGLFLTSNALGTECEKKDEAENPRLGQYELVWVAPSIGRNEMACGWIGPNKGYWLGKTFFSPNSECATSDNPTRLGEFELGVTM